MIEKTFYQEAHNPDEDECYPEHELNCTFEQNGPRVLVTVDCQRCHHHDEYHLETEEKDELKSGWIQLVTKRRSV